MLVFSLPGVRLRPRPASFPPFLALFLLVLVPGPVRPLLFYLPGKARKCLREEFYRDTLVTVEYEVAAPPGSSSGPSANLKITDSAGYILYSKEDATKGKFAFTTEYYDIFEACFESKLPVGTGRMPDQLVTLNMKHGVEAKNYEENTSPTADAAASGPVPPSPGGIKGEETRRGSNTSLTTAAAASGSVPPSPGWIKGEETHGGSKGR